MSVPYLNPSWRVFGAGHQTSAAGAAVLGSGVNVASIERTGAGRYTITLDDPADPDDTVDLIWTNTLFSAVFEAALATDTERFVRSFNVIGTAADAIFRFTLYRFHAVG